MLIPFCSVLAIDHNPTSQVSVLHFSFIYIFCFSAQSGKSRDYPWEIYTLKELVHATNNFHNDNKIGEGGFGSVYWGRTSKGVEAIILFLIL